MNARVEHLVGEGLARRQAQTVLFARDLLEKLRQRELAVVSAQTSSSTGLPYHRIEEGDPIVGVYRRRLDLASGRFALIDDGLGFSLVPWSPSLERHLGQRVSGSDRHGRIEWCFGRKRGPAID